jgi:membrane protein
MELIRTPGHHTGHDDDERPLAERVPLKRLFKPQVGAKRFLKDLWREINDDNVSNGAASLAYFLMLSIFPATIFLLSLLPYLPIPHLQEAIMDLLREAMPAQAATMFTDTVNSVVSERRTGLLSFGALATLWAASSGMHAVIDNLNVTYDVKETRSYFKVRGIALLMLVLFGVLIVGSLGLVVFGGVLQAKLGEILGMSSVLLGFFAALRWLIILGMLMLGFALTYYFGPNVEQSFRFITPGTVFGTVVVAAVALGFRFYVSNFGSYEATYGSIGAVIIMLFWLYLTGLVLLLGSEVNALVEHYAQEGKNKGETTLPR